MNEDAQCKVRTGGELQSGRSRQLAFVACGHCIFGSRVERSVPFCLPLDRTFQIGKCCLQEAADNVKYNQFHVDRLISFDLIDLGNSSMILLKSKKMNTITGLAHSAAYNVLVQLSFRISTFVLNGILLRYITRELLGVVNVRLMLFYTTVSFLVREPFRKSCISTYEEVDDKEENKQTRARSRRSFVNVLWLCPLLAIPVCVLMTWIWTRWLSVPSEHDGGIAYYQPAVFCYAVAICIETWAEPLFIFGQMFMFVKLKAFVDAFYIFVRQILFAILILWKPEWSLLAFGVSMIISSFTYTFLYYVYFYIIIRRQQRDLAHRSVPFNKFSDFFPSYGSDPIDQRLLKLIVSFWSHSAFKQLLTEGERYIMTIFDVLNFADQGIYDVVTNLGSLVARCIFAPLEESSYVYFSLSVKRGVSANEQDQKEFQLATKVLSALLKLVTLIGLVVVAFGLPYSFLALQIYGGEILSSGSGPVLLRWFCVYVTLLAINGITECFTFAIMRHEDVNRHQRWLVVFCGVFLVAALLLTKPFGSVGFVLANCVNMMARITYSVLFIQRYYRNWTSLGADYSPLKSMIPSTSLAFVLFVSWMFTSISAVLFCCDGFFNIVAHIAVGAVFFVGTLWTVYGSEAELVDFVDTYIFKGKLKRW